MSGNCPPYQCPICGRYLNFNLDYFCGSPHVHYKCDCGYDTDSEKVIVTTSATPIESDCNKISTSIPWYQRLPSYYTTNWNSIIKIK